jgi:hypothetical protein
MKVPTIPALTALRTSAVLTLVGLGLMVWSMLQPTPLPVMLAMTVGQGGWSSKLPLTAMPCRLCHPIGSRP